MLSHAHFQTYSRWVDCLRQNSIRIIVFLSNRNENSHSHCLIGCLVQKRTQTKKIANVNRRHIFLLFVENFRGMDTLRPVCLAQLYGQFFQDHFVYEWPQKRVRGLSRSAAWGNTCQFSHRHRPNCDHCREHDYSSTSATDIFYDYSTFFRSVFFKFR